MSKIQKLELWMIGEVSSSLPLDQLATVGDILKVLHYQQFKQNQNINMCYANVAKDLMRIWEQSGLTTLTLNSITQKMNIFIVKYRRLKKDKKLKSAIHVNRREHFMRSLESLFNISDCPLEQVKEKRLQRFLKDQNTHRILFCSDLISRRRDINGNYFNSNNKEM
jgi:hypothetical protein